MPSVSVHAAARMLACVYPPENFEVKTVTVKLHHGKSKRKSKSLLTVKEKLSDAAGTTGCGGNRVGNEVRSNRRRGRKRKGKKKGRGNKNEKRKMRKGALPRAIVYCWTFHLAEITRNKMQSRYLFEFSVS